MIDVVICEVGKKPYQTQIPDELKEYQRIVGGYIDVVTLYDNNGSGDAYLVVVNEEGMILNQPLNCSICGYPLFGTIFVVKRKGTEFGSVDDGFLERFTNSYWKPYKGEQ